MPRVTALLLDGPGRAEVVLDAIQAQTRRPDEIRRVEDFAAVSAAAREDPDHWLWLLDPSAIPHPEALDQLLAVVETSPSVAVAGCKQVTGADGALLVDVGYTMSRRGSVVTGIELNEVDQGQYDDRSDVLAVRLPGVLVREDVWRQVGAPTPTLDEPAAGLEFCRCVRLAGHRVVVVPTALVAREPAVPATAMDRAGALHLRLVRARWWMLPFALLWALLVAPPRAFWRLLIKQPRRAVQELRAAAGAVLHPRPWLRARKRDRQLRTVPWATPAALDARPAQVWRQRRDDLVAYLFWSPSRRAVDPAEDSPRAWPRDRDGDHGRFARTEPAPSAGRRAVSLLLTVSVAAVVEVLALRRALPWGTPDAATAPAGPALLPAPESGSDLWALFTGPWRPVGLGAHAPADPFTGLLAGLSMLTGGSVRPVVDVVLLGALPLAALTAWLAVGTLTRSGVLRFWAGLAWAAAPALLVAVSEGRIAAALAHVVLPLLVLALARSVGYAGTGGPSLTAAAAAGLCMTVLLAAAPSLTVPVAVLVLVAIAAARAGRWLPLLSAAVPVVVLWPWWAAVAAAPRLLLADPSNQAAPGPQAPDPWWHLVGLPAAPSAVFGDLDATLAGTPLNALAAYLPQQVGGLSGSALVATLAACGLVGIALVVALLGLTGRRFKLVATALGLSLLGLEVAVIAARVDVGAVPAGNVRGWTGPAISWFTLGVLVAAAAAARALRPRMAYRPLGVLLALTPVVLLAGWAAHGWNHGVGVVRVDADTVPEVSALEATGPAATRTLVLRLTTQNGERSDRAQSAGDGRAGREQPGAQVFSWVLQRFAGPRLGADSLVAGEARLPGDDAQQVTADDLVTPLIGDLAGDTGKDVRPALAALAIGSIQLLPPLDDATVLAFDASPGLVRSGRVDGSVVWRVDLPSAAGEVTRPARARVLGPDGGLEATVPSDGTRVEGDLGAGAVGRRVVLAEHADPHWRATFDGEPLVAELYEGWAVAFTLPPAAGHLVIDQPPTTTAQGQWLRGAVLILVLLLAVPVPRLRRRVGAPPRVSRTVPRQTFDQRAGALPKGAPLGSDEAAQRWAETQPETEPETERETEPETERETEPEAGPETESETEPESRPDDVGESDAGPGSEPDAGPGQDDALQPAGGRKEPS